MQFKVLHETTIHLPFQDVHLIIWKPIINVAAYVEWFTDIVVFRLILVSIETVLLAIPTF